jgi:PRTRC genetic system ThiF family protein
MSPPFFITPQNFASDRKVRVVVVGAGGNGSQLLGHLGRLDRAIRAQLGKGLDVTVFDPDSVSEANVGRQVFGVHDIGFNKAIIMVHSVNAKYDLDWHAEPKAFDPNQHASFDLLVGCVDSGRFRHALGQFWHSRLTDSLWLDLGNGADSGQVVLGHLGKAGSRSDLRLPNVYDLYGDQLLAGDHDDMPSCSLAEALQRQYWSVNPATVSAAAPILDGLFLRGGLRHHGSLIRIDPYSVVPLLVDPEQWSEMGL